MNCNFIFILRVKYKDQFIPFKENYWANHKSLMRRGYFVAIDNYFAGSDK